MSAVWTNSLVQVGECPVQLSIEQLDEVAREHAAAVLAWLTLEAVSDDGGCAGAAWHDFVAEILREHVTLSIPDEWFVFNADADWWTEATAQAFMQFLRANELSPRINSHLDRLRAAGGPVGVEHSRHGKN